MSAPVQALVLVPLPDLDAAGLVKDVDRRFGHRPDASISAIGTSKMRPPSRIWTAVGQDPETAEPRHRERDRRGELRAMIVIDFFGENHRFSN
jgi:hypothetical protein